MPNVTLLRNPTRFPGGITNNLPTDPLANMPQPDPSIGSYLWLDQSFDWADASATTPVGWTVTAVGVTPTRASPEVANMFGALTITNTAADNDSCFVQSKGHVAVADATKRLMFACRVAMSNATQADVIMGLTATDTTPVGGVATEETGVSDGMYFLKIDDATDWRFVVRSGSVTISYPLTLGTVTASTPDTLAFDYNPANKECALFVNGVKVRTVSVTTFPAVVMYLQMGIQNGDAVARALQVDWVASYQERNALTAP